MNPTQKMIIKLLVVAIVLTAPTLLAESGIGPAHLPKTRKAAASDRPTASALRVAIAEQQQGFPGARSTSPTSVSTGKNIYADSIILQHGDTHTLLPRHAILYTPPLLQKKITRVPRGQYMAWPAFYSANRSWIFTYHVTLDQASGKAAISANVKKQFVRIDRIVVSLFQNYPISTLPKQ